MVLACLAIVVFFLISYPTADYSTGAADRIDGTFNMSVATRALAVDTSKNFDRVCHTGFFSSKSSHTGFLVRHSALFFHFTVIGYLMWFWV